LSATSSAPSLTNSIFDPILAQKQPLATKFLTSAILKRRLAHAYLFSGRSPAANLELTVQLAAYLNCTEKRPISVDQEELVEEQLSCALRHGGKELASVLSLFCQNCRWILTDTHPQALIRLDSEGSKSGKIAVEKTRLLTDELGKESQFIRVIYVPDAHQEVLHRPAANAILKTIEDPRSAVVFMLFAVRSEEVLPTIVSRCQVIPTRSENADTVAFSLTAPSASPNSSAKPSGKKWQSVMQSQDDQENIIAIKSIASKLADLHKRQAAVTFLEITKELQTLGANDASYEWMLDALIEEETGRLSFRAISNFKVSKYLEKLIKLEEETKLQIEHYVSPKAAIESFCLSWYQLKNEFGYW
jgi:DNA polymerase III delta prime subunit